MIFIAGGTLAFFFGLLLLGKKPGTLPDNILTFWMFIFGLNLFVYYCFTRGVYIEYPHLLGLAIPLPLIHGPLLFLYAGFLTRYFTMWKPRYFLHFLPVVIFALYYYDFFISAEQEKVELLKVIFGNTEIISRIFYPSILVSGFSYIFLTFLLFRRHRQNLLNNFSNITEKNNLQWLRYLLTGLLVIWLVVFLSDYLIDSSLKDTAIYVTVTLFVVFIGFFGLRQGNIFTNLPDVYLTGGMKQGDQQQYVKSGLKEARALELKQQLAELMDERKIFLDENISLPHLAGIMDIHPNYLSQVINEKFQKNFYDFINSYRVEEFKRVVSNEKNRNKTFLALAMECGFNSKASFNNAFKKTTGKTPSEFVRSL